MRLSLMPFIMVTTAYPPVSLILASSSSSFIRNVLASFQHDFLFNSVYGWRFGFTLSQLGRRQTRSALGLLVPVFWKPSLSKRTSGFGRFGGYYAGRPLAWLLHLHTLGLQPFATGLAAILIIKSVVGIYLDNPPC